MEEGLYSYCTQKKLEGILPLGNANTRLNIKSLGRLGEKKFCREGYSKLYAFNRKAFPGLGRVEVVPFQVADTRYEYNIGDEECVWICESLSYMHTENVSISVASIVEVLSRLEERYNKVYFKIHPDSYGGWQRQLLINLVDRYGPTSREIGRAECIEDIAVGTGADVVLNVSSTGLYCGLFSSGTVYTYHDIFSSNGNGVGVYKKDGRTPNDWVPGVFWRNVKSINELDMG
jgi:hypothetical protein